MQRITRRNTLINKAISTLLVLVMLFALYLPSVSRTMAMAVPDEHDIRGTILYFEQSELVYEVQVDIGTALADIRLPAKLRAVISEGTETIESNEATEATEATEQISSDEEESITNEKAESEVQSIIQESSVRTLSFSAQHITRNINTNNIFADAEYVSSENELPALEMERETVNSGASEEISVQDSRPQENELREFELVMSELGEDVTGEDVTSVIESGGDESSEIVPGEIESSEDKSSEIVPGEIESGGDESSETVPGEIESGGDESSETEPSEIESNENELGEIETGEDETSEKPSEPSDLQTSQPGDGSSNGGDSNGGGSSGGNGGGSSNGDGSGGSVIEDNSYVLSIPVTWEGEYNGDEEGVYILTAVLDGFRYTGVLPIAKITVGNPIMPPEEPQRAPIPNPIIIDLGQGKMPDNSYQGYTVTTQNPNRTINFDTNANGNTYEIVQTATFSAFWTINVNNGINTTIIFSGIDSKVYFGLHGNASLNLYLQNQNNIEGYITVRENTTLNIDSYESSGSESGILTIRNPSTTYAGIGGFYRPTDGTRSNSGTITINGGTINVIQTNSSNNINSAGIGGGDGTTGTVNINGGRVEVSIATNHAHAVNGALIGGGYGSHGYVTISGGTVIATSITNSTSAVIGGGFGGTGVVHISKGTVIATIPSGGSGGNSTGSIGTGAAIGGGKGSGNTTSGIADVTITGGNVTATSRFGAAIGGGMRSSNATINITGGTISATAFHGTGAAIGGGGGGTGSDYGLIAGSINVNISDGKITAKSDYGAGIGIGAYERASTPAHSAALSGLVTITGGQIIADVDAGNGVGTGMDNLVVPQIKIDKEADILVFGRQRTAFAGIYAGDNTPVYKDGKNLGTGYYVNLNFPDSGAPISQGTEFIIFLNGNTPTPFRVITAPFNIGMLSFTTGSSSYQEFLIYTQTASGTTQLAHASSPAPPEFIPSNQVVFNDGVIYSVIDALTYHAKGHVHDSYFRSLTVKGGNGAANLFKVTEKYVDVNGNPFTGFPDTTTYVEKGKQYNKTIPDIIPAYTPVGYKWNNPPSGTNTFDIGTQISAQINSNQIVYFIYMPYTEVDVSISKKVVGSYADKSPQFSFDIYFTDLSGIPLETGRKFSYIGSAIPGEGASSPANGELTLQSGGTAKIHLYHGQMITLKNVPSNIKIRVIEVPNNAYRMSYEDSIDPIPGTRHYLDMEASTVGTNARRFSFYNAQEDVAPTGFNDNIQSLLVLALVGIVSISLGYAAIALSKRRLMKF